MRRQTAITWQKAAVAFACLSLLPEPAMGSASTGVSPRPIVTRIAGIGIGFLSSDADVVETLGPGCLVPTEPHSGGRYYTNTEQTLTLHVVLGVDRIVDSISLRQGFRVAEQCVAENPPPMTISALEPHPPVDQGLRLGMSEEHLRRRLGEPDAVRTRRDTRVLTYSTAPGEQPDVRVPFEAQYEFAAGLLSRITLVVTV